MIPIGPTRHRTSSHRTSAVAASGLLALALSACTLHGDPEVAVATPVTVAPGAAGPGRPPVKTVRPSASSAVADNAEPLTAAVPAPRQIFDFHPAGTKPDDWRQPFVIDPNDGPLAADVRRSAAELRTYLALVGRDPKPGVARRCSETDVATAKPGCAGPTTTGAIPRPSNAAASPGP